MVKHTNPCGAALGRSLTEEIRNKANEAAAMLVLYTDPEQDWEWVMFEVGIGLDPSIEAISPTSVRSRLIANESKCGWPPSGYP